LLAAAWTWSAVTARNSSILVLIRFASPNSSA
jgi:hypothetical protein